MKRNNIIKTSLLAVSILSLTNTQSVFAQTQLVRQVTTTADTVLWDMPVYDITLKRNADLMTVGVDMGLGSYRMHGDKVTVFTPVLKNGNDSLDVTGVGLYSRIRYIQYLRDGREPASGSNELSYRYSKRPSNQAVIQSLPYEEWMSGATLYMERRVYGCCHTLEHRDMIPLGKWYEAAYKPAFHYVTPEAELIKIRVLKGRAYIDFPVNMTNLYPDYRNNPRELQTIIATIDSVRNDKDVNIREITIKGYASPESPWSNNTRLAMGRTATLKKYVQNLYQFDENLIKTDYCPEDWEGLREFVEKSGLKHKAEILAIIDDASLQPDPKEALIKSRYPEEYEFLHQTVYPALRHSDYTIEFTIRHYSDPEEIRRIMATAPQKLSLDEFFILAKTLEPGSDEYNEVFETAVRMYPKDETANLNAANSAMQRGDLESATKYLNKAGSSDAAIYARGVLATLKGEYREAANLFASVANTLPEGADALAEIEEIMTLQ